MDSLEPKFVASLDEQHLEICFSVSGFWDADGMREGLKKLDDAALPLVKERKPLFALGDFTGFVPQTREVGNVIQDHLNNAKKVGLKRIAIVEDSALAKMQYKRLAEGIEVEFFGNKSDAKQWLREGRS